MAKSKALTIPCCQSCPDQLDDSSIDSRDEEEMAKQKELGDENTERGNWGSQLDFMLSCIGYAVGLGNLWRFPYLCMRNGGGAFLIPYFIFLFLCGIPLFFLELALGQYSSLSPLSVWRISPMFKGLGWGMVTVSAVISIYYNLTITWVLYYLFNSFTSQLPWATCDNWWNTAACSLRTAANATNSTGNYGNETMLTYQWPVNGSGLLNATLNYTVATLKKKTPAEEFWEGNMLQMSGGIEDMGTLRWQLVLCLVLAWVIVFACLFKGVKSSGKVVYVTATVPYIFLTALLIRGFMLPGAMKGVKYYVTPDFNKLAEPRVWAEAALQIFYSLGPAWGGLITMSSYNKFHNNCYRDAIIVPCVNCFTSFYAGLVIFSVLGFMAEEAGVHVSEVITSGPGLAFVAYPEAITKLPISPMWAIFFFTMLLTLGLDSQFSTLETSVSSFVDEFPRYLRKRKTSFMLVVVVAEFLVGLPLVCNGGIYVFQIMDWYCAVFSIFIIALLECVIVAYVYGVERFYDNIEAMIGYRPSAWWKFCWMGPTPILMGIILCYNLVMYSPPTYGDYEYPPWAITIGWMLAMSSVIPIPIVMIYRILTTKGTLLERIRYLLKPEMSWRPALEIHRQLEIDLKHKHALEYVTAPTLHCIPLVENGKANNGDVDSKV